MNLFRGIVFGLIAQIVTFLQLQGQLKYDVFKNNLWFTLLMGIPGLALGFCTLGQFPDG